MTGGGQHQALQSGGTRPPGGVKSFVVDQIHPGPINRSEDRGVGTTPMTCRRKSGGLVSISDKGQGRRVEFGRASSLDRGQGKSSREERLSRRPTWPGPSRQD